MRQTRDGPKPYALKDIGLTWGDPRKFMDELNPILWNLVLLAKWGSYDFEGFERLHRLYADDFWARIQGKAPVKEEEAFQDAASVFES